MKRRNGFAMGVVAFGLVAGLPSAPPAAAQTEGEEKCSPDGYVMTYNKPLNAWIKQWLRHCSGASRDGASRSADRDEATRDTSERTPASGQPEDGDEKCVAGHILQYHRYQTLPSGWSNTFRSC